MNHDDIITAKEDPRERFLRTFSKVRPAFTDHQRIHKAEPESHQGSPGPQADCASREPTPDEKIVRQAVVIAAQRRDLQVAQQVSEERVEEIARLAILHQDSERALGQFRHAQQNATREFTRGLHVEHPSNPHETLREVCERLRTAEGNLCDLADVLRALIDPVCFAQETYIGPEIENRTEGYSNIRHILSTLHDNLIITQEPGTNPVADLATILDIHRKQKNAASNANTPEETARAIEIAEQVQHDMSGYPFIVKDLIRAGHEATRNPGGFIIVYEESKDGKRTSKNHRIVLDLKSAAFNYSQGRKSPTLKWVVANSNPTPEQLNEVLGVTRE